MLAFRPYERSNFDSVIGTASVGSMQFVSPPRDAEMDSAPIGDARFFARSGPHSLAVVAEAARGTAGKLNLLIEGLAPLQSAGPNEVSFLDNRRYVSALKLTRAGAVIVRPEMQDWCRRRRCPFSPPSHTSAGPELRHCFIHCPQSSPGIHPSAFVAEDAVVDRSTEVGPMCVIEAGARIGPGCRIGPGAVIGAGVVIGRDCRIGAHASLSHALVGARVYVYPGARIGQEGFGFGPTQTGFLTAPQLGRVILEDDVEVGANTTIDRGSIQDTVIGAGSRLDNLVQIGHNVVLGRCCVIVAQAGIAGSTVLEDFVQIGGQAALNGHLKIGRGARIGAQAGVMSDVSSGISGRIPRPAKTSLLAR